MGIPLLLMAVAPCVAIAVYVWYRDHHEREPLHLLVKCFVLGAVATFPTLFLGLQFSGMPAEFHAVIPRPMFNAFILAGLLEEYAKFAVLYFYAYPKKDFNEPFDGITYSVMVAMGFATLENVLFVLDGGMELAVLRMLTAVPAHGVFGVVMGFYVGAAKFRPGQRARLLVQGFASAALFHGFYDFCLMQRSFQLLALGSALALLIGIILSAHAMRLHSEMSPYKPGASQPDEHHD